MGNEICKLLKNFNQMGYADESAKYELQADNSKMITHKLKLGEDEYVYNDKFWGGEPYGGYEIIYKNGKEVFACFYYGKVYDGFEFEKIYGFLRESLREGLKADSTNLHRGPESYIKGDFAYSNKTIGDIEFFCLEEKIEFQGKQVYIAKFNGGFINLH